MAQLYGVPQRVEVTRAGDRSIADQLSGMRRWLDREGIRVTDLHAVRRKWPRRASNRIGELARVLVPEDVVVRPRAMHAVEQFDAQCNAPVPANGHAAFDAQNMLQAIRETVDALVTPLREQLTAERSRADQAERRLADKDATITGLVAEQQAMRQQVETLTELLKTRRAWWRRVFGR